MTGMSRKAPAPSARESFLGPRSRFLFFCDPIKKKLDRTWQVHLFFRSAKRFALGGVLGSTIKDIAKQTGLSIATVSKFINGGNVLPENRALLEKSIKDLDFEVNQVARGLKKNRTMLIGVIVPNFESKFFMRVISNIENSLMRYGYSTIVCDYRGDYKLEVEKIHFLYGKKVDGIILPPNEDNAKTYKDIIKRGISLVFLDRPIDAVPCDAIIVDNRAAARKAVESFLANGHTKIGLVNMNEPGLYTAHERLAGYLDAHEAAGLEVDRRRIAFAATSVDGGYDATLSILDANSGVTAILATNDDMAFGAIKALNARGLRIPDDIALIGFDVYDVATVFNPELSVVVQPLGEIGETAADLIVKRLGQERPLSPRVVELKTELILRGSSEKSV